MRIKMSIPRSESDRPLLFKDEMMKLFHEKIPNFADKDVICHHSPPPFFLPCLDQIFFTKRPQKKKKIWAGAPK